MSALNVAEISELKFFEKLVLGFLRVCLDIQIYFNKDSYAWKQKDRQTRKLSWSTNYNIGQIHWQWTPISFLITVLEGCVLIFLTLVILRCWAKRKLNKVLEEETPRYIFQSKGAI